MIASNKTKTTYVVSDKKASGENEKINVPLSPTISIGDTNLNGYKDIVVSGINGGSFFDLAAASISPTSAYLCAAAKAATP